MSDTEATHELTVDEITYVCRTEGEQLRLGRRTDGDVEWYPDTVPAAALPEGRRDDDALRGIISAIVNRGG